MAYPHMDTKIPLRVVYPLLPYTWGAPFPYASRRPPPLRIIFENPLYAWGYLMGLLLHGPPDGDCRAAQIRWCCVAVEVYYAQGYFGVTLG